MNIFGREMTQQQVFDEGVAAILKQGKPAWGDTGCVYRATDGCKCLIGHLMPDDQYLPDWDRVGGTPASTVTAAEGADAAFLNSLQECHDDAASGYEEEFLENFIFNARNFAHQHELSTEVLDAHA